MCLCVGSAAFLFCSTARRGQPGRISQRITRRAAKIRQPAVAFSSPSSSSEEKEVPTVCGLVLVQLWGCVVIVVAASTKPNVMSKEYETT